MSNTRKHNGHDQPINGFSELKGLLSDPEAAADTDPNAELPFGDTTHPADRLNPDDADQLVLSGSILSLVLHENAVSDDRYFVCTLCVKLYDAFQVRRISDEDFLDKIRTDMLERLEKYAPAIDASGNPINLSHTHATDLEGRDPDYSEAQLALREKLEVNLDHNSYVVADLQRHFKAYNDTTGRKLQTRTDAQVRRSFAESKAKKRLAASANIRTAADWHHTQATERRAQRAARIAATA